MNDQIQIERIESEFIRLENETESAELKTVSFQGQQIKEGSVLYCFKYCAFIKVVALTDCFAPGVCVVFEYGEAEFVRQLNDDNFCTIPTQEQINKNLKEFNHAINTRNYHQIVGVYSGRLVKSPAFERRLFEGEPSAVVQFLCTQDLKNVFIQTKFVSGSGSMKKEIPVVPFLNVFFRDRKAEYKPYVEGFKIKESIRMVWNQEYNCELRMIDGIRQHPEGLSFSEWIARRI